MSSIVNNNIDDGKKESKPKPVEKITTIHKELSLKDGKKLSIYSLHNKRMITTTVFLEFNTKEKELLNALLQQYIQAKVVVDGINVNNGIINACATTNGIVIVIPENKLISNISLIFKYLSTQNVGGLLSKYVSKGNYDTLSSDIKKFNIYITGKCKNFGNSLRTEGDKKIEKLSAMINDIKAKKRDSISNDKPKVFNCDPAGTDFITVNTKNDAELMDVIAFFKNIPFVVEGSKLKFLSLSSSCMIYDKLVYKNTVQEQLKTWKSQCGKPGKPAANDKGKHKEKVEYILECMNMLCTIYGNLHGLDFQFSSINELLTVNSNSSATIKSIK